MKRGTYLILFISLTYIFLSPYSYAQGLTSSAPVQVTGSDPTGNACTSSSPPLVYGTGSSRKIYQCESGTYAAVGSGGGSAAGSSGDYQINSSGSFGAGVLAQSSGRLTATPTAASSGVASFLRVITPADTGLTADTEALGIVFGGNASSATVTRTLADGTTLATQREYLFVAPTYAAAGATTLTNAIAIEAASPIAGTNITQTNSIAARFIASAAAHVPLVAKGAASQSGNLQEWQNSSGTALAAITSAGSLSVAHTQGLTANGLGQVVNITATSGTITLTASTVNVGSTFAINNRSVIAYSGATVTEAGYPLVSLAGTWNASGVTHDGIKLNVTNTASAAGSKLLDLQIGAAAKFSVTKEAEVRIYNGTAPASSVTDGVILYAEDVSSSSELKVRDEAGNSTTLSPHNFSLIPTGKSEDMAWAFYSERDGTVINVDMLRVVRLLERITGEKLVYIGKK